MKSALTAFSVLLVCILIAGCSDDDCPSCPAPAIPAGIVNGNVFVSPGIFLNAEIVPQGSVSPSLDSMHVGDSLLVMMSHFGPYVREGMGGEVWWEIHFGNETGPDYMHSPGDTVHIDFWGGGHSAECNVVVLNPTLAEAEIISPVAGTDTVSPGESVTIYWHRIEHVQYYGVALGMADAAAAAPGPVFFDWTTDTAYTVNPERYPDSLVSVAVTILPFTGPSPASAGNVAGGWLSGRITSFGIMDFTLIDGWADGGPLLKPSEKAHESVLGELTPVQIIDEIYRGARQ